jgi:hypothetical protein
MKCGVYSLLKDTRVSRRRGVSELEQRRTRQARNILLFKTNKQTKMMGE